MNFPRIAVVILNWNGKNFLKEFLPSVIENTSREIELIVADNASDDDSLSFLKKHFPRVRIIALEENYGFAGGYNKALQEVSADYFILLNSDMEVSPGWVEPVIELMEEDEKIVACQPLIRSYHKRSFFEHAGAAGGFLDRYGYPFCRGRILHELEPDNGQYNDSREVFWATGACLFIKADAFWQAGGFDSRFFAHMEEIDLCWRLKNMGYRIMVCPRSVVYHVGGGTLPQSNPRKTFLNFRNSLWLLAKNLPGLTFYRSLIVRVVLDMPASFVFLLSGKPRDFLAVYKAYINFFGAFRNMRKFSRNISAGRFSSLLYKRSIVVDYYMKGKKKFSDLEKSEFT